MVKKNKFQRAGIRTALSAAILLTATSASAVTVDGNLADLIGAVGSNPYNVASDTDPQGNAEATENNNGFDIKNVYAFYDWPADVLYLGMNFFGAIGDSQSVSIPKTGPGSIGYESFSTCASTFCNRSVFDLNEKYGIQLYRGTSDTDPQLLLYDVLGVNDDSNALSNTNLNPYGLTIDYSVVETQNGVEFSISGLHASGAIPDFSFTNPVPLAIFFRAGSSDTNSYSTPLEDNHLLQMQVVPVPAAIWLLGSGLVGLLGFAKQQRRN